MKESTHRRIIDTARLELEAAGSPAYAIAIVDTSGIPHLSPMVFSTPRSARELAERLHRQRAHGDEVAIVSRVTEGHRAMFTVYDRTVERRLHRQLEVIESSLAETQAGEV